VGVQVCAHVQTASEHRTVDLRLGLEPRDRFAEECFGPHRVVLVGQRVDDDAVDVAEQRRAAGGACRRLRPQQNGLRLLVFLHVAVFDPEHQVQSATAEGIVGELALGELLGSPEQLGRGQRRAVALG
jgi:hypothetical protein